MTSDGLVAFNQASGLAGNPARARPRRLAPDPDRRRQDLHLPAATEHPLLERQAGQGVRLPLHVRARLQDRQLPVPYYDGIVGATRCEKSPKRCDLSRGIVADDAAKTVTFHLVAPDPEFLDKLALAFAYVVPAGTPPRGHSARIRCPRPGRT